MLRHILFALVVGLALVLSPSQVSAQFYPSYVPPNALYQNPAYSYQFNLGTTVPTTYGRAFIGLTVPFTTAPQIFSPNTYSGPTGYGYNSYAWSAGSMVSPGYLSGGYAGNSDIVQGAQRKLEKAQRQATYSRVTTGSPVTAKDLIYDQWAYEKLGVQGLPNLKPGENQPDVLIKAINATDESEVASGVALNHILVAIVAAEGKGGKGASAFLPPQSLDEIRFIGNPVAEALNFIRLTGKLPFPSAFDDPKLKSTRDAIEKDFAAAAGSLREGKPADPLKIVRLEVTLKSAQDTATPILRNLPFEDAAAARRFLNKLEIVVKVMKTPASQSLINPAWMTEGSSVSDLVKYMTKQKVLFGPATPSGETVYLALHKGLVNYLFAISQTKK